MICTDQLSRQETSTALPKIGHVLQRAALVLTKGDIEPQNRKALIDQLRTTAARLAEDAGEVARAADKLARADSVYTRMKASDDAAATLSSILADLG